jgi:6-phosphogluconolactonase
MSVFDLREFPDAQQLARTAAMDWVRTVSGKSAKEVTCSALSGGRVAGVFLSAVANEVKARRLPLDGMHFFWSDERCVPPADPESNFRLANELLLMPLNIPANQVHRIPGEKPPAEAATLAETDLRSVVTLSLNEQPVLDLVILGMGEDGHVASLFPGEAEDVMNNSAVFRYVKAVKPPPLRITLGYSAIAAARQVWVLASGPGKHAALHASLDPQGSTPLARVLKLRSNTRIYSDIDIKSG